MALTTQPKSSNIKQQYIVNNIKRIHSEKTHIGMFIQVHKQQNILCVIDCNFIKKFGYPSKSLICLLQI